MSAAIQESLAKFDPRKIEKYDPGQIVIFFDNRLVKTEEDQFSMLQTYRLEALYRLGWPSWEKPDLHPGKLRLAWYTHVGAEGYRDFPLWMAYTVKEMFESLSDQGFRPMVLGWSAENPFPMIGGSEPPVEPKVIEPKRATTWSATVSGHGRGGTTPYERVMDIINEEERKEAERRRLEVEEELKDGNVESAA